MKPTDDELLLPVELHNFQYIALNYFFFSFFKVLTVSVR